MHRGEYMTLPPTLKEDILTRMTKYNDTGFTDLLLICNEQEIKLQETREHALAQRLKEIDMCCMANDWVKVCLKVQVLRAELEQKVTR
jgi:hypothetical protein